jgi:hypothetical protein
MVFVPTNMGFISLIMGFEPTVIGFAPTIMVLTPTIIRFVLVIIGLVPNIMGFVLTVMRFVPIKMGFVIIIMGYVATIMWSVSYIMRFVPTIIGCVPTNVGVRTPHDGLCGKNNGSVLILMGLCTQYYCILTNFNVEGWIFKHYNATGKQHNGSWSNIVIGLLLKMTTSKIVVTSNIRAIIFLAPHQHCY